MKIIISKIALTFLALFLLVSFKPFNTETKGSVLIPTMGSSAEDGTYINGKYFFGMEYDDTTWVVMDTELFADENMKAEFMAYSDVSEEAIFEELIGIGCYFLYKPDEASGFQTTVNIVVEPDTPGSSFLLKNKQNVKELENSMLEAANATRWTAELKEKSVMRKFGGTEYLIVQLISSSHDENLWTYHAFAITKNNTVFLSLGTASDLFDELVPDIEDMLTPLKFY